MHGADHQRHSTILERQIIRIVNNSRSLPFALAMMMLATAFISAILVKLADEKAFGSFGIAIWWGVQTITTVGYGDVVPTTPLGRVVGSFAMLFGVSFISFLTAGITSAVVQREAARGRAQDNAEHEERTKRVIESIGNIEAQIAEIDARLSGGSAPPPPAH